MTNKTAGTVGFIFGTVAGFMIAQQLLKDKYEKRYQEERDSLRKTISAANEKNVKRHTEISPKEAADAAKEKPDLIEYAARLHKEGYTKYGGISGGESAMAVRPYVISPEEFGEIEDYERISLIYFADGILTDEGYEVIEDVDETVGEESLDHFGEFEADSVFVRNDLMKCDYEILQDNRTYAEVLQTIPHPTEE